MAGASVGWLERPVKKVGLDNLGTQQPCIMIYTRLLPGITNVTDRAAYFGFYPWFVYAFDRRFPNATDVEFRNTLRRADCLATLIAERHAIVSDDHEAARHGATCPGRQKLAPAALVASQGQALKLDDYADRRDENPTRYFKNPLGGLGQYYLGPLRDEYLVFLGDPRHGIKFTLEHGRPLAESYADGLGEEAFFAVLAQDEVNAKDLDSLADFCPCALQDGRRVLAQTSLIELLVSNESGSGSSRRTTFGLLMEFLRSCDGAPSLDPVKAFLGACYAGALHSGLWRLSARFETARQKWALYLRNEMMSLAWSNLFKTALDELGEMPRPFRDLRHLADWLVDQPPFAYRTHLSFTAMVNADREAAPRITDFASPDHELDLWRRLTEQEGPPVENAVRLLVRLIARWEEEVESYKAMEMPPGALAHYPLTLDTMNRLAKTRWRGLSCEAWMKDLLIEVLAAHQRVAIRKLGQSGEDTLMFRSTDAGMFVDRRLDRAVETQPRLHQALQIMRDLGLTSAAADRLPKLTDLGRAQLEQTSE